MAQTSHQQIQVIQQPLSTSQFHQLYMPQQHIVFPGNLTVHQAGTETPALQSTSHVHIQPKKIHKTSGGQNIQPYTSLLLHSKSPYSSPVPVHSSVQVFNGSNLKQVSPRQIITSQTPGTLYNQPQMMGSHTYALSPLPPGYSWSSPGYSQSPFIVRSPQPNIYLHSTPQNAIHMPVSTAAHIVHPPSFSVNAETAELYPCGSFKLFEICHETQTIATQTIIPSTASTEVSSTALPPIKVESNADAATSPWPSPPPLTLEVSPKKMQTNQSSPPSQPQVTDQLNIPVLCGPDLSIQMEAEMETESYEVQDQCSSAVDDKHLSLEKKLEIEVFPAQQSTVIPAQQSTVSTDMDISTSTIVSTTTVTRSSTSPALSITANELDADDPPVVTYSYTVVNSTPIPELDSLSDYDDSSELPVSEQKRDRVKNISMMPHFNPIIKLKRLKPQDPLGPLKDKHPQKAIVKPQMLTQVNSYAIEKGPPSFPVSLKSPSNSPSKVVLPEDPCSKMEKDSFTDTSPENKDPIPIFRVVRGRGRPRGSGRAQKKKLRQESRKSLRRKAKIKVIDLGDTSTEVEDSNIPEKKPTVPSISDSVTAESPIVASTSNTFPSESENSHKRMVDLPQKAFSSKTDESHDMIRDLSRQTFSSESKNSLKMVVDIPRKLPQMWSVQDVFEFVFNFDGCMAYAEKFKSQEIDGHALLLMKLDHLMTGMCMKLGPAVKLFHHIMGLKEELKRS